MDKSEIFKRSQSLGEEIANSLSHGVGLVASLVGATFLIGMAIQRGSISFIVGASVFAITMVMLYAASTVYHALPRNRAKRVFLVFDHAAIFVFIAGCYTPFTLGVLRGVWGWTLFGIVWGIAVIGVASKIIGGADRFPRLSTAAYLGMGWIFLIVVGPLWQQLPIAGMIWLLAGGISYTVGGAFFRAEKLKYAHFVWHLFVIAGTACHFVAVWKYAI